MAVAVLRLDTSFDPSQKKFGTGKILTTIQRGFPRMIFSFYRSFHRHAFFQSSLRARKPFTKSDFVIAIIVHVKSSITVHHSNDAKYSPEVGSKNGNGHSTPRMPFTFSTSKVKF